MPGAGWSQPKPWHWRVLFRRPLDTLRRLQKRWTVEQWRAWAVEDSYGLDEEIEEYFWSHINAGIHPSIAARWAREEWDV